MRVLEKLFKDAKEVRKKHLIKIGQQSYAGITRRIIQSKYDKGDVLILGSGQLARDSIKHLMKKYNIFVSARNDEKVQELISDFPNINIRPVAWKDYSSYNNFNSYVNTIGCSSVIFTDDFFFIESHEVFIHRYHPVFLSDFKYRIELVTFPADDEIPYSIITKKDFSCCYSSLFISSW